MSRLAAPLQPLLDLLGVVSGGRKHGQPQEHVRDGPWADREDLVRVLQLRESANLAGGEVLRSYLCQYP
jgi:hypothetical protein